MWGGGGGGPVVVGKIYCTVSTLKNNSTRGTLCGSSLSSLDFFVVRGIICVLFLDQHGSSAAPQIPLCRWMLLLGSNPGLLRLWHWLSDALTSRIDLIHLARSYPGILYLQTPNCTCTWAVVKGSQNDTFAGRLYICNIQGGSDKSGILIYFLKNDTTRLKTIRFY